MHTPRVAFALAMTAAFSIPAWSSAATPRLLSLAATSSSMNSGAISGLFLDKSGATWSPGMKDRGVDEGIYLEFEDIVSLGAIDVVSDAPISVSVNGNRLDARAIPLSSWEGPATRWRFGLKRGHMTVWTLPVHSIFIRIAPETRPRPPRASSTIHAIRFYQPYEGEIEEIPLQPSLPVVVPTLVPVVIKASSVLAPAYAYQAAFLFDSRVDFAWSTDGSKTSGLREWIELAFSTPMKLSGMLVWNGYQRSENHFRANSRIGALSVDNGAGGQTLPLKDGSGMQRLDFSPPLSGVQTLRLTVQKVIPGDAYSDLLLSELRFIDATGAIILPQAWKILPTLPESMGPYLNRSFRSALYDRLSFSLKLRSDGSFAVFRHRNQSAEWEETVWEGNWVYLTNQIRFFGKRYASSATWTQREYGLPEQRSTVEIFQTEARVVDFASQGPAERARLVALALQIRNSGEEKEIHTWNNGRVSEADTAALKSNLAALFESRRAIAVESPLFSDIFVPTDSGIQPY